MYQKKFAKMDSIDKMLRHVNNLNDYVSITQELAKQAFNTSKVQFNMSTVLLLKKVKSLEIEYFNKCEGNGAALVLFGRMVEQPPSKTWGLLGKEMVLLLQYWLDAIRKHLIKHSHCWWTFLELLLNFIKNIRSKDRSLPDILVEGTTECLLDLATSNQPSNLQRHEILCCLNIYCAESSREIRFALRNKFESYFGKLASLLRSCGHLPTQYGALETLLRWLLPRAAAAVRLAAANKWFPEETCGRRALDLFLERPWMDFFQDARDFLNAYNDVSDLVTSVVCRKITAGTVVILLGTEKRASWLDVNSSSKSLSVVLDLRILDALGVKEAASWETLMVPEEDVNSVQLFRQSSEVTLVVKTSQAPRLRPSGKQVCEDCELRVTISSSSNLKRLDNALRSVFADKYQVLLDVDTVASLSPQEYRETSKLIQNDLEEDTRFSHPVDVRRRKHSGFIVRPRNPVSWQSPSTASTSSLAQLHEKLESLPQYKFDKEAVHVCALPELSTVTEVSEADERQSILSTQTLKINRPYGVCQKNLKKNEKYSQSDGEIQDKPKVGRYLSPIENNDERSNNCLLVATIGSADESVINDTLERLTKNKDFRSDDIVNLLVQEALQKDLNDSGINTGDNTRRTEYVQELNSEAIENTPIEKPNLKLVITNKEHEKTCTVISNTTTDESNDVVCDTPNFITVRKRMTKSKLAKDKENTDREETKRPIFDVKAVEEFFSQHIAQNKRGDILISPTLARKINETSSESEPFEDCLVIQENNGDNDSDVEQIELQDLEIVECLNSMVDKVCSDFEKCEELLKLDTKEMDRIEEVNNVGIENPPDIIPLGDVSNVQNIESGRKNKNSIAKPIKLKFTAKKTPKSAKTRRNLKQKNKSELLPASNMSPIKEREVENVEKDDKPTDIIEKNGSPNTDYPTSKSVVLDTPVIRRKRKLYSPKYENIDSERNRDDNDNDIEEFKTSKIQTPKYKSTCYKDIETERKKRIRQPRARNSRGKSDTPSPRTKKKNEMFDQLKEKLECPVTVISTNKRTEKDMAIYNYTSDSEDEDFKKKKIEVQKRISSTTIASCDSAMSTRKGRTVNRVNYSENKSSDETVKQSASRPKRTVRRKRTPRTRLVKPVNELIDEKMRKAVSDELNISIIAEKHNENVHEAPQLKLDKAPEMEVIPDEVAIELKESNVRPEKPNKKQKKAEVLSLKKANANALNVEPDTDDRTISPLPGLVIETMPSRVEDANDSVCASMLQKLKKIHQDGPEEFINETNTTQNLLSDLERITSTIQINITDELNKFENDDKPDDENTRSSSKSLNKKNKQINVDCTKLLRVKKEISDKNKRKLQKEISIINLSDTKSEKSIATVGKSPITAHGDFDEAPPHSDLLKEIFKPRDLEIEYLDESTKDYFNKLRNEVNDFPVGRKQSNDSISTKVIQNVDRDKSVEKSPVLSIKRLSYDDISKWLPSPRHSYSSRCSEDSNNDEEPTKSTQFKKYSPDQEMVTKTSVHKLDEGLDKVDIRRSKRTKAKTTNASEDMFAKNTNNDTSRHNTSYKWLRSHGDVDPETSSDNNNDKSANNPNNKSIFAPTSDTVKSKIVKKGNIKQPDRKSMISPIKFFDEVCFDERMESLPKRQESTSGRELSVTRPESSIMRQRSINDKLQSSDVENYVESSKISPIHKKPKLNKLEKKLRHGKGTRNTEISPEKEIRTLARYNPGTSSRKRLSNSPEIGFSKRRKTEDVTISESGPSVSSVNEWFRRNNPVGRAESIDTSLRDSIQNVMEKLDTTLVEIHQNTSKKFIHLFVDAQSKLAEMRRERRAMFKSVASEILARVVSIIDDKFADMDRRSQDMHNKFTERLKTQASALIREDCSKKQAMVLLLREDLDAMLATIDKNRSTS